MKPHEEWLYKANNDLRAAQELIKLVPHKKVERVHDIRAILEKLIIIEPRLGAIREDALTITPYATLYRYPGDLLQPDKKEAEEAVESAKRILRFIEELIG
jgi:HEPN domain-containing protein